jgi:hypothetical protein
MITVRGNKVCFKGKDAEQFKKLAANLGLSEQDAFTGMLWERIMQLARQGIFLKQKKAK